MYEIISNAKNIFTEKKIQHLSVLFLYVILAYFLLINGEGMLENWDQNWTISIMIYMIGVNAFININEKLPSELKKPMADSIIYGGFAFIFVSIFFIILHMAGIMFQGVQPINPAMAIPLILFQVVTCPSEEFIFRGAILSILYKIHWVIAYLGSAGLFAVFHFVAYGGSIPLMVMAFGMGLILNYTTIHFNIGVSIAIHLSYNLSVLGIILVILYA